MLQPWDNLQACAFPPFGLIPQVLSKVRLSRNLEVTHGSLLAPQAMVPGSSGAAGEGSVPPACVEGSSQTAPLSSFSPEPPRSSVDWVSYHERSTRRLGFSSRVAHQLTFSRRSSTHLNYQAKWVTCCAWCHHKGHSVSHPSISPCGRFPSLLSSLPSSLLLFDCVLSFDAQYCFSFCSSCHLFSS